MKARKSGEPEARDSYLFPGIVPCTGSTTHTTSVYSVVCDVQRGTLFSNYDVLHCMLMCLCCCIHTLCRLDQARLADILGTDLQQLQLATALAVRLGFATRLNNTNTTDELSAAAAAVGTPRVGSSSSIGGLLGGVSGRLLGSSGTPLAAAGSSGSTAAVIFDSLLEDTAAAAAAGGREGVQEGGVEADGVWGVAAAGAAEGEGGGGGGLECGGGAVAVVVDAETTSCLMMGALSAGKGTHMSCSKQLCVLSLEGGGGQHVRELCVEQDNHACALMKLAGTMPMQP